MLQSESTGLPSNHPHGACPWCRKLSTNSFTLGNHIRGGNTKVCHICGMYSMLCSDIMKKHTLMCMERNLSLISGTIYYSFGEDCPSNAPKPVRSNVSHTIKLSDDDTPCEGTKQLPSTGKHATEGFNDNLDDNGNLSHVGDVSFSYCDKSDSNYSLSPQQVHQWLLNQCRLPSARLPPAHPRLLLVASCLGTESTSTITNMT